MTSTTSAQGTMSTEDYARLAADIASDNLGSDIALLDLKEISDFADFFVIATGETPRHLESIANELRRGLREQGLRQHHREGTGRGGWILIDFPGVVIHLFNRASRERYGLEELWSRATEIVRIQ